MTRYLLDTNVVSSLAPLARRHAGHALIPWMDANSERLFVPSVVLAELTAGIAKLRRLGRGDDAEELDEWLASVMHAYFPRILPLDHRAAHHTGLLMDRARAARLDGAQFADIAIAGIALAHGLVVLTRNLRHFAPLGVLAHDPYAALPD